MEAFAASAATAVATAQTVETQALERSVEASELERRRWARELHDDSLQELAAVKLRLGALARDRSPRSYPAAVAQAIEHVDASIQAMRSLITDMRPASLDQLGVGPALEALAERWSALSGHRRRARRRPAVRGAAGDDPARAADRDHDLPRRPGGADERRQARGRAAGQRHRRRARRRGRDRGDRRRTRVLAVASRATASGSSACASASGSCAGGTRSSRARPGTTVHAWIPAARADPAPAARAGSG